MNAMITWLETAIEWHQSAMTFQPHGCGMWQMHKDKADAHADALRFARSQESGAYVDSPQCSRAEYQEADSPLIGTAADPFQ